MSTLIDIVVERYRDDIPVTKIDQRWYIAKPLPMFTIREKVSKLKDALRVLIGTSFAVHYKEDE